MSQPINTGAASATVSIPTRGKSVEGGGAPSAKPLPGSFGGSSGTPGSLPNFSAEAIFGNPQGGTPNQQPVETTIPQQTPEVGKPEPTPPSPPQEHVFGTPVQPPSQTVVHHHHYYPTTYGGGGGGNSWISGGGGGNWTSGGGGWSYGGGGGNWTSGGGGGWSYGGGGGSYTATYQTPFNLTYLGYGSVQQQQQPPVQEQQIPENPADPTLPQPAEEGKPPAGGTPPSDAAKPPTGGTTRTRTGGGAQSDSAPGKA